MDQKTADVFLKLISTIAALRHPVTGCPWDLEQTHLTLRPYLVEETYEVLEAIDRESDSELREELGDLLLQVVLHSQLATERGAFTIGEVASGITEKMIRRHPHVFGDVEAKTSGEVLKNWEQIKTEERNKKAKEEKRASVLDGVPSALPSLLRAQRLGEKASRVAFDWSSPKAVWEKVEEELGELKAELREISLEISKPHTTAPTDRPLETQKRIESEIGDLLFSICQFSRWLGVSAEDALRGTIERFTERFRKMEGSVDSLAGLSEAELDAAWQAAKDALRKK